MGNNPLGSCEAQVQSQGVGTCETPKPQAAAQQLPAALLQLPEDKAGSSPEQVELDSSSLFPQSLSPSQSQRLGMQRLFLHLKRSEGQVCWSVGGNHTQDLPLIPPHPSSTSNEEKNRDRKGL